MFVVLVLLLVLLVRHLVFHVGGEDSHCFLAHLAVFELRVTPSNFAHFCINRILLDFLGIDLRLVLLLPSELVPLSN